MRIFISWSGDLSHKVALIFKEWLPSVMQSVEVYVSSEDIDKGARWSSDISKALEESFFGILCITKDNIDAPWINFEAGALSRSFEKSKISPFLFGLSRVELHGPLLQFQSTIFEKSDINKLVSSINKACTCLRLKEHLLNKYFEMWWPELEEKLKSIEIEHVAVPRNYKDRECSNESALEEILLLVRSQQQLLLNPENMFSPGPTQNILKDALVNALSRHSLAAILDDLIGSYAMLEMVFQEYREKTEEDSVDIGEDAVVLTDLGKAISRCSRPIEFLKEIIYK